jgi:hypothetical protein
MSDQPIEDDSMPTEVDFSNGVRGLHHIPPSAKSVEVMLKGLAVECIRR